MAQVEQKARGKVAVFVGLTWDLMGTVSNKQVILVGRMWEETKPSKGQGALRGGGVLFTGKFS